MRQAFTKLRTALACRRRGHDWGRVTETAPYPNVDGRPVVDLVYRCTRDPAHVHTVMRALPAVNRSGYLSTPYDRS